MFIRKVKIEGFRSYKTLDTDDFEFSPEQNIIIGLNGHGKSNLLNGKSLATKTLQASHLCSMTNSKSWHLMKR